jgi:undecaprenyl diphosphate synthase
VLRAATEYGIQFLTIYAFSTENWDRPRAEVRGLMNIFEEVVDTELAELHENGVQLRHIGRLERLSPELQKKVLEAVELTKDNSKLVLNVAWNYGGRDEIIHAVQRIIADGVKPEEVTEELIHRYLFTSESPDPDLIIRTSGELRVSNFLIWQSAYSEWIFTNTYWPEFGPDQLLQALWGFAERERRYGRVVETASA